MRIDKATEDKIKEAASIVDVVGDYVQLKRAGAEYTGRCPFHADRHTGSFMVSPKKNIATCFPCDETWNPVDFVMKMENLDYPDALRWLAKKYHIEIKERDASNRVLTVKIGNLNLSGVEIRTIFGLKSAKFQITILSLQCHNCIQLVRLTT